VEDPSWDIEYGEWKKESIDAHQFATNVAASVLDHVQNFSVTADLPPKESAISANATIRAWITETSGRQRIVLPFEEDRVFEPFYFTEALKFATNYSAQQTFTYNPEIEEFTDLVSSISLNGFTAAFSAIRSRTYSLVPGQGWVQDATEEEKLNPRDFRIGYTKSFTKDKLWNDRIALSTNTNSTLTFDLQRYSYSKFNTSLGFTLGIKNLLDFSFSAASENAVVMRYFQDLPFVDLPQEIQGEKNLFVDLFNSFWPNSADVRKTSGFKLKAFNFALTHYLGDWTAKFGITLSPYLDTTTPNRPQYKFNNEISILVQWVPITEIKTDIYYNKEKFEIR
jgi:hypothetical protein